MNYTISKNGITIQGDTNPAIQFQDDISMFVNSIIDKWDKENPNRNFSREGAKDSVWEQIEPHLSKQYTISERVYNEDIESIKRSHWVTADFRDYPRGYIDIKYIVTYEEWVAFQVKVGNAHKIAHETPFDLWVKYICPKKLVDIMVEWFKVPEIPEPTVKTTTSSSPDWGMQEDEPDTTHYHYYHNNRNVFEMPIKEALIDKNIIIVGRGKFNGWYAVEDWQLAAIRRVGYVWVSAIRSNKRRTDIVDGCDFEVSGKWDFSLIG